MEIGKTSGNQTIFRILNSNSQGNHRMASNFGFNREHTYRDWLNLLNDYNFKCYWCNKPLTEITAQKDHLQPISRNGTDQICNIVPACAACNSKKGNMNEEEFMRHLRRASDKQSTGVSLVPPLGDSGLDEKTLRRESEGGCPTGFRTWKR
jgi:5-methylcytosine-specific restriction endonuclease McrA